MNCVVCIRARVRLVIIDALHFDESEKKSLFFFLLVLCLFLFARVDRKKKSTVYDPNIMKLLNALSEGFQQV